LQLCSRKFKKENGEQVKGNRKKAGSNNGKHANFSRLMANSWKRREC
jgi:hypothetical protein